jgi:hypothetical protein
VERGESLAGTRRHDARVECLIEVEYRTWIDLALTGDGVQLGVDGRQLVRDRRPGGCGKCDDLRSRQPLEMPDDLIQLARVLARQRRNDDTAVPFARLLDDVAFPAKPVQRSANRCAADAKTLRQRRLDHPAAGRQLAVDDELAQLVERPRDAADVIAAG